MQSLPALTPEEFVQSVLRTANRKAPTYEQCENCVVSLLGELGELANIYKKNKFHGHPVNLDKYADELGDVLYYLFWLNSIDDDSANKFCESFKIKWNGFFKIPFSIRHPRTPLSVFTRLTSKLHVLLREAHLFYKINDTSHLTVRHISYEIMDELHELAASLGLKCTLGEVAYINQQKLLKRYPEGFSSEASQHRKI